jgi:hypothetical protein
MATFYLTRWEYSAPGEFPGSRAGSAMFTNKRAAYALYRYMARKIAPVVGYSVAEFLEGEEQDRVAGGYVWVEELRAYATAKEMIEDYGLER